MKYSIVYCDPPYRFKNYSDAWHTDRPESRWVGNEYSLLPTGDIKELPIADICADDCVLVLWATYPMLPEAMDIMESWGFRYSTVAFTWVKTNRVSGTPFLGMGYYTRANCEIALLGIRGKPLKRISRSVRQLVISPIEKHSKKPDAVRDRIVELFGDVPRIELFARDRVPGWDALGDAIDGEDIRKRLRGHDGAGESSTDA